MSGRFNVSVQGDKALYKAIKSMSKIPDQLNEAFLLEAEFAARLIKREAPYRKGILRRGVKARLFKTKGPSIAYVISSAPHSHFVEHGTSRGASPNPFFSRGIEAYKKTNFRILRRAVAIKLGKI